MTFEKKAARVSIVLCMVASFISLCGAQSRQSAASSHLGASAPRSDSAAGASAPVRGAGSGGASTWGTRSVGVSTWGAG